MYAESMERMKVIKKDNNEGKVSAFAVNPAVQQAGEAISGCWTCGTDHIKRELYAITDVPNANGRGIWRSFVVDRAQKAAHLDGKEPPVKVTCTPSNKPRPQGPESWPGGGWITGPGLGDRRVGGEGNVR